MMILQIFGDFGQQLVGKIAVFEEISAVFEVDDGDFGVNSGGFGLLVELNEGIMGFGEVIIDDIRGGGAGNARDFELTGNKTGETESRIARGVFLIIGTLMGFVDDD